MGIGELDPQEKLSERRPKRPDGATKGEDGVAACAHVGVGGSGRRAERDGGGNDGRGAEHGRGAERHEGGNGVWRGLALCAGAGGLELGLSLALPGYRAVCWVERDAYAASSLVARMEEAALDDAPVWADLAAFDGRPWRGAVDIVTAGWPGQRERIRGRPR